jgi:hypothetical protein
MVLFWIRNTQYVSYRQLKVQGSPTLRLAGNFERTTGEAGAFAHAEQAVVTGLVGGAGGIESSAVV